ncbi:sigma-54-dependent Fis family transcriptional regulator [Carboxydothermus islandicus]|uniref:HTH-type transcriptional regulatory protein TyrR n=1 Tax=Carboxydothermus islandicus TaxID=661089 RepID=A0A1L8D3T8_9THEO|nr:sigma 54-interacting transcriptional regulator [Carboxydothermus islandicus]GAV25767.1 sigma-54-dependent Fis family transcriptional regulator [Carboxydothermus islandicus]
MGTVKLSLDFEDRVGLVLDVSRVISARNLNIITFQVLPGRMFLEIEKTDKKTINQIIDDLKNIPKVLKVHPIEIMPYEQKEQQLRAVLDTVNEGIIAIDSHGIISICNQSCAEIFGIPVEKVIGQNVGKLLAKDIPMLKTLKTGESYNNQEIIINVEGRRLHYLTSGRPIKDRLGNIVGVVAVLKPMSEVRELVYAITKPSLNSFNDIIYASEKMRFVVEMAQKVAKTDTTVLIRGESGTGKELFARAIHLESPRRTKPFVPLNCAAVPESLLESELFGYVEGAFTGAKKGGKQGLLEFAHEGTLFLDEIAELPTHLQAKLLRVLQEGKVRRIGGQEEIPVDIRIIAATNRNLEGMVREGKFREDLYFRLNVFPLQIPPLRERVEDIEVLAYHFLNTFAKRRGIQNFEITENALNKLKRYSWPGNVRELQNVIERALTLADDGVIEDKDIILDNPQKTHFVVRTLEEAVNQVEKELIERALKQYPSIRQAAKSLGVTHTTLRNKIKKLKLTDKIME